MNVRPDIVVRDRTGRTTVVVEIKARRGVDAEWAARVHRNLLEHGGDFDAAFFILVTATDAYLWRKGPTDAVGARVPDAQVSLPDLVGYDPLAADLDGRTLELVVQAWLAGVASETEAAAPTTAAARFVTGTGLVDALRGAVVEFQPA